MKKSIRKTDKKASAADKNAPDKKNGRPFSAKQKGYKEDVYNNEEQKVYDKSELANKNKKNTSGPA